MNIFQNTSIFCFKGCLIAVYFQYESRVGVRLLVWSPPSSLALSGVSYYNLIARTQSLAPAEFVDIVGSFCTSFLKPGEDMHFNLPVITKQLAAIFTHRLELADLEGLQLFFQRCSKGPPAIDVARGITMWPRSVVNNELHHMCQLTDLIWKALHDVFDQHTHNFLGLLVLVFH